ncbi:large ribosomal subunit protein bL36m [Bacillus rossius redtenbacheri]|uniref:large ribosomal subunit protein bL36m n=1 Tax=Bacillus rossius redtenbacheri TaxID=93214 RepID=UPI002FDE8834
MSLATCLRSCALGLSVSSCYRALAQPMAPFLPLAHLLGRRNALARTTLCAMPPERQCHSLVRTTKGTVPLVRQCHVLARTTVSVLEVPRPALTLPTRGFKVKRNLKRRCKDCYFVIRERRLYVLCKTHPRHKQMSMKAPDKCNWILTHATQSRVRPW